MKQAFLFGSFASLGILALYWVAMTALNGWEAAVEQFRALWWLMVPLSLGFGTQVALYTQMKTKLRTQSQKSLAAGGTSASVGMLACCAHHATDLLPILGLSGIGLIFLRYQIPLLLVSLGINVLGIYLLLRARS